MQIPFEDAKCELKRILMTRLLKDKQADKVAHEMVRNSLEGTYSHGINRFARLIRNIDEGIVRPGLMPVKIHGFGALENYDGQLGLGITNAWFCMDRAIELARQHGLGFVAMRNTNHWLRAATYGYQACDAGMAAICTSNTRPNMPTWGATDCRLGNNPLVMAFPRSQGHVMVDMAMSQFSYGAMELAQLEGRQMRVDAGFDVEGNLTRDPAAVIKSRRILPMGYWKGTALSFVLDLFAGCMSLGNTTAAMTKLPGDEHGLSQIFMAINYREIAPQVESELLADDAIAFLLDSKKDEKTQRIFYAGQRAPETREKNLRDGIPVNEKVWENILKLG